MRKQISSSINENKVQVNVKVPKLHHGTKRYILTVRDGDSNIYNLIDRIKTVAGWGHSFPVSVDPDNKEYNQKFYIDGDGSDQIFDITIEDGPKEEEG